MSDVIVCPDCGHENAPDSTSCERCNFPLQEPGPAPPRAPGGPAPPGEPAVTIPRPVRRPRPRPGPPVNSMSLMLWLVFGVVAAAALVWTAYSSFRKSNAPAVEGVREDQKRYVDSLMTVYERDTTNVAVNIELGNICYDTANWERAIPFYSQAIARDSSQTGAIVDLGVCYFQMQQFEKAEEFFQLALRHEPGKPQALMNLGIVYQLRGDNERALKYMHSALENTHDAGEREQVMQKIQQLMEKTGKKAPPLEPGAIPQGMPPNMPGMPPAQPPSQGGGK